MKRELCLFALALSLSTPALAADSILTPKPTSYQVAGLFGESDEEIARRQQHENGQDDSIADLRQRVNDLELSLRRQTGQNEQLTHKVQELTDRMQRMQKDFDYKLCTITAQQMSSPDGSTSIACNPSGQQTFNNSPSFNAAPAAPASSSVYSNAAPGDRPIQLAPPPGTLGTLPAGTPLPQNVPGASVGRSDFDDAMNLLAKAQYGEASGAFRSFADAYPKDDLAPQAVYWVANIAYVQKDYATASRTFAEEIKKYPSSPRAPESMLKLGESLIAMNQIKEGCTALGALPQKYPNASKTILAKATATRKASCK